MFHRIKSVEPLNGLVLNVEFVDGTIKCYDVNPLLEKKEVFKDLAQGGLFRFVRVDVGGYGISWNDYIDIACNELWENGRSEQKQKVSRGTDSTDHSGFRPCTKE
jgi:hypothetical protein